MRHLQEFIGRVHWPLLKVSLDGGFETGEQSNLRGDNVAVNGLQHLRLYIRTAVSRESWAKFGTELQIVALNLR